MPRRLAGPCPVPGCPNRAGQCAQHASHRRLAPRQQRGYDATHDRLRREYQARMDRGERFSCWRCGSAIDPTKWDLGHGAGGHRGPECVPCNRGTNGRGKTATHGNKVVLVCGPPCSGKSTYVQERAQIGDLIVDFDVIAKSLGSVRDHNHDPYFRPKVEAVISRMLSEIAAGQHARAWVIRSLPKPRARTALADHLGATVVVLDAPDDALYARAKARPNPDQTIDAIRYWRRTANAT